MNSSNHDTTTATRPTMNLRGILIGALLLLQPGVTLALSVPDPDHTFYGLPTENGGLIESGEVVVRRPAGGVVLATYQLGAQLEHGGRYVLRVPMELGPTVTQTAARTGDAVEFYIDGVLSGEAEVGEPGETTSLNLELLYGQLPELWVEPLDVAEGDSGTATHEVVVHLSRAVGFDVTFSWSTANGTAVAGSDYTAASGSGAIDSGETSTIVPVSVLGETVPEPTEAFSVVLTNPVGAVFRPVPDGSQGLVRILADDTEWIASVEDGERVEGDDDALGSVRVVVQAGLPALTGLGVDIDWELVAGTATAGQDFVLATGTLTVDTGVVCPEVGHPCGSIDVEVLADDIREGNEDLLVRLTDISAGSLERDEATFTIVDDERYLRYLGLELSNPPTIDGLAEPVAVAVSPDGASVYAASSIDDAISVFSRDAISGDLTFVQVMRHQVGGVLGLDGASGVVVSPDGEHVYTTGLFSDAVTVFDRNTSTGALTFVEVHQHGVSGVSGLDGATAVAVSADGQHLYTAARNSHAVSHFTRNPASGSLTFVGPPVVNGVGATFIQGANALALSPNGDHLFLTAATDSTVTAFARNSTSGVLTAGDLERDGINDPGDAAGLVDGLNGARSVVVSPTGSHVYVAGELEDSISVFSFTAGTGELQFVERKRSGLSGVTGIEGVAALVMHPNGRFLFAAARGGAAVTVLERNQTTGRLTWFETRRNGELEEMPDTRVAGLTGAVTMASAPGADHLYVGGQLDAALVTIEPDNDAPLAPTAISTTHTVNVFSLINEIGFEWSGARDLGVGIAGYSYLVDGVPTTEPALPVAVPHGPDPHTYTTPVLADGLWYFHLRTCDVIANCTTQHLGPFAIDTTNPLAPTNLVKTNPPEITIEVAWTAAVDPGLNPSGLVGYWHSFTQDPAASCTGALTLPANATTASSGPVADGFWYFHICAEDGVGLRSPIATLGPVVADSGVSLKVDRLTAVAPPADDSVEGGEVLGMTQLRIDFNRPVALVGAGNGFDLDNYQLVDLGENAVVDSTSCTAHGGDDVVVEVASATWVDGANRLYLELTNSRAVPAGRYTLRVCDTLADYVGRFLDGDGDETDGEDFVRPFQIATSNLLENPNIDHGLDGWTLSNGIDILAQDLDVREAPTSGSLRLENNSGGAEATLSVSQCLTVHLGSEYFLTALARVDNADGGEVVFGAVAETHAATNCSGQPADESLLSTTIESDTAGSWLPIELLSIDPGTGLSFPAGTAVGLRVSFAVTVGTNPSESWVGVDLDELVVAEVPAIFISGFETGDTAEWSNTVP